MERKRIRETILFTGSDVDAWTDIKSCLEKNGCGFIRKKTAGEGFSAFNTMNPDIVIIDTQMSRSIDLLEKIRTANPDVQIMLLSGIENLYHMMRQWKFNVSEFLGKPVNPDAFHVGFNRMQTLIRLNNKMKTAYNHDAADASSKINKRIEDERYVTVRQIIDRISVLIDRLADDVEGGVKYFAQMPHFVSIHDRDCNILAINPAFRTYFGNKLHCPSWEIYKGKEAHQAHCPAYRTIETSRNLTLNATVCYTSGAEVPVIVHTSPIYNDDGEVEMVLEVFAGTKDIDRMSEEISKTQQRYHQLFDEVPCYLAVVDRNMTVAAVNRLFKEAFGDQTGQRFYQFFNHINVPLGECSITHTLNDGMPHQSEMVLISHDGKQHNMMTWTKPVVTVSGKLIEVLIIFIDITELRKTQENLTSLGLMISTLSHSLKGILTGLDAGLYFIENGFYRDQPGRIEEGLDVSKLMAERIRRMVYDVLYYAKERDLQLKEVDVSAFSGDVAASMEKRIRAAGISFVYKADPGMGVFKIDSTLLRSALINLLENAMEACIEDAAKPSYEITFTVTCDEDDIVFDVSDNGSGIDKNRIKQIFTLFYSSKGNKGTGLGLFIVRLVVQKHGGHISADSDAGHGTRFHVKIPRRQTFSRDSAPLQKGLETP